MTDPIRLGIAGLGRGFMLMLPSLRRHPKIRLAAAADPRAEARDAFAAEFGAVTHATVAALCDDPSVEAIYIATPHQYHVQHVRAAAAAGKHVMVEKPMALSVAECQAMIDAARQAGVQLLVGHSHSFDLPYLETRRLIASGAYGALGMITAVNFTDFLYRPRRPEELDTASGGGVVFSQGAHQIDIVRLLAGGLLRTVRANAIRLDPRRPTEGAYNALLRFDGGVTATLTYSGMAHFDTDELCGWAGELGQDRNPAEYGVARASLAKLASAEEEAAFKNTRAYGLANSPDAVPPHHNHFGFIVASCAGADLRPGPDGVEIYADAARSTQPLPSPEVPRAEVMDEFHAAIRDGIAPLHSGEWGMATLEACLAVLESARTGREVELSHQVAVPAGR